MIQDAEGKGATRPNRPGDQSPGYETAPAEAGWPPRNPADTVVRRFKDLRRCYHPSHSPTFRPAPKMVQSDLPRLRVLFFRTASGREPVRDWLRGLDRDARKVIGEDIKTVQFGWPLGMPLVRSLGEGLWEVRSHLRDGIARVIFVTEEDLMVLLHGFMKQSQRTPKKDLALARQRAKELQLESNDEREAPGKQLR